MDEVVYLPLRERLRPFAYGALGLLCASLAGLSAHYFDIWSLSAMAAYGAVFFLALAIKDYRP